MDSIVQADVPIVVGYRWVVSDDGARDLAGHFYSRLFCTWSAEDALFYARSAVSRESSLGRDDETWASPVLVVQSRWNRG